MIAYWAVPYLVVAAPPAIVLLTILVGSCTMARTANEPVDRVRFYSDRESRAGEELIPLVNEDAQPALWVLITIYRRLLERIVSRQFDVFTERVALSVREKVVILAKGYVKRLL